MLYVSSREEIKPSPYWFLLLPAKHVDAFLSWSYPPTYWGEEERDGNSVFPPSMDKF